MNILVTTDFSKNSIHALSFASELFKYKACKFYVLHVVKAGSFISDDLINMKASDSLYQKLMSEPKEKLKEIIDAIENNNNNILHEYIPLVDYDGFIEAVNQVIELHAIDLVVMGTKGVSNLEETIFGSNTLRVFQRCNIAVLAIPDNTIFKPFKHVLFTSKYKEVYNKEDLSVFIELAEQYNYAVDVLHLTDDLLTEEEQQAEQALKQYFKNVNYNFVHLNEDDFLKTVVDYSNEHHIELFVMMRKKHTFLEHLLLNHNTKKVAYNLEIPFLILPNSV